MFRTRPGTDRAPAAMPGILARRGLGDTNPLILVVEDDPLQQSLVRHALEQHGYRTDVAGDGLSAVQRLRTGQYSLALMDYHLPQVDGVEAARLLRDVMAAGRRPRMIAVTGDVDTVRERTESEGIFDAMLQKPLQLGTLLALVDDHLRAADREVLARRTTAAAAIRRGLRRILC